MSLRRFLRIALGLIVTAIMLLSALTIPALRHRHAGGERAHSHHGHAHSHHSHTHSHSHGAHTHHHHHEETPGEAEATTPHIHIVILGFELTLPDIFGEADELVTETTEENAEPRPPSAGQAAFVPPHLPAQVIQFVLELKCSLPDWTRLPADCAPWSRVALAAPLPTGCEAPLPPDPPPRTV